MKKRTKLFVSAAALGLAALLAVPAGLQVHAQRTFTRRAEAYAKEKLAAAAPASATAALRLGDVNGDGSVDVTDARFALQTAADLRTLEGNALYAADFDCDDEVSLKEVRIILRGAAGLGVYLISLARKGDRKKTAISAQKQNDVEQKNEQITEQIAERKEDDDGQAYEQTGELKETQKGENNVPKERKR